MPRLSDEALWDSVEVGLSARIDAAFGIGWWVKIVYGDTAEYVNIRLMHANPGEAGMKMFAISMPFPINRWASDSTICAAMIDNFYEALSNWVIVNWHTPKPVHTPDLSPRMDRFDANPAGKRAARAIDGSEE